MKCARRRTRGAITDLADGISVLWVCPSGARAFRLTRFQA